MIAAKKKPAKGTLSITVSGSGSYTVTGKSFRKSGTASKSFKVKPGVYTVKAPTGSVSPGKAKVRKGKATRVSVTFPTATPTPTETPVTETPPAPTPTPTPSDTPTSPPPPSPPGVTGAVTRVSSSAVGAQGAANSWGAEWSPDGTRVAFASSASNLVGGDTNNRTDVFVKTLADGTIQRVSLDAGGAQANRDSYVGPWSPDGTRIAFTSGADNLVAGDSNGTDDVFVKTLATGAIQRISTDAAGNEANYESGWPAWSPDGTQVAFVTSASNLIAGDSNGVNDVFVKTLASGAIKRISTDAAGNEANANGSMTDSGSFSPAWSPDGAKIAFVSDANNLVTGDTNGGASDIFVKTLAGGAIQRISTDGAGQQTNGADSPVWSPDGTRIAFDSYAANLVTGDTNGWQDVFVKTLATGAVQRVSTGTDGKQADSISNTPAWSPDGTRIMFSSHATNLIAGDTQEAKKVYVKTLSSGLLQLVSADVSGTPANDYSYAPESRVPQWVVTRVPRFP